MHRSAAHHQRRVSGVNTTRTFVYNRFLSTTGLSAKVPAVVLLFQECAPLVFIFARFPS